MWCSVPSASQCLCTVCVCWTMYSTTVLSLLCHCSVTKISLLYIINCVILKCHTNVHTLTGATRLAWSVFTLVTLHCHHCHTRHHLFRHVAGSSYHLECWYFIEYCHSSLDVQEIAIKGSCTMCPCYHVWAPKWRTDQIAEYIRT